MGSEPKRGEIWSACSNDGSSTLDLYLIGRSRQDPRLWVAAPLLDANQACRYDICAAAQAVAVWCFIWVETARLNARVQSLPKIHDEVFALYRFLVSGKPTMQIHPSNHPSSRIVSSPGEDPALKPLNPTLARELIERTRPFVWRGDPESWAD